MFLADTHIHSLYSHDSQSRLEDICLAAKEKGIGAVCITDHADVKPTVDMQKHIDTRKGVYAAVEEIRKNDCSVELLLGIELACGGYYPNNEIFAQAEEKLLTIGTYDCVIGSVHSVGNTPTSKNDFSEMSEQELIAFADRYFSAVLAMLEHGHPDVLAHLTYPLRYINGKFERGLDWRVLEPKLRQILQIIIQRGIALEVNTSCLGSFYDELLPNEEIIQMYLQMGGYLLTLGSDAHKPENVGKGFAQAIQRLKKLGVTQLHYLKKRQIYTYPI